MGDQRSSGSKRKFVLDTNKKISYVCLPPKQPVRKMFNFMPDRCILCAGHQIAHVYIRDKQDKPNEELKLNKNVMKDVKHAS